MRQIQIHVAKALIDSPETHTMDQSTKDILIGKDPLDIDKEGKSFM